MHEIRMNVTLYKIMGVLRLAPDMLSRYKQDTVIRFNVCIVRKNVLNEYVQKKRCQAFHMLLLYI